MTTVFDVVEPSVDGLDPKGVDGIVDGRALIGTQMVDIGRLQSHFLPIIPGGFVAVSGQGPSDSNESAKTTFEAAVAFANGDPEWKLRGQGPAAAAGLLFSPVKDGDGGDTLAQAKYGFILCVYARMGGGDPDPVTVWTRINATSPYSEWRYTRGVHIATGHSPGDRLKAAKQTWDRLGQHPKVGPHNMLDVLFGGKVTCIADVSDRGDLPRVPSLLTGIRSFSPKEIGKALVTLSGLRSAFDREERAREEYDKARNDLTEARQVNGDATVREDVALAQLAARATAREVVTDAAHLMRLHYARGYLDAVGRDRVLASEIDGRADDLSDLERRRNELKEERAKIADRKLLDKRLEAAQDAYDEADRLYLDADRKASDLERDVGALQGKVNLLRPLAELHDGGTVEDANTRLADARDAEQAARDELQAARRVRVAAVEEVEAARKGSNATVDALRAAGVDAVVLHDVVIAGEAGRARWEPLLHPWRDTVVVAPDQVAAASRVLSSVPGAMMAVSARDDSRALPDGIDAADPRARRLLEWLDGQDSDARPVTYAAAGLVVFGGFPQPTTGREAREAAALAAIHAADTLIAAETAAHERKQRDTADAVVAVERAEAAAALPGLNAELAQATRDLGAARGARGVRKQERAAASRELTEVTAAVRNHDAQLRAFDAKIAQTDTAADALREKNAAATVQRARLNVDFWAGRWGGTEKAAAKALEDDDRKSTTFKNRANEQLNVALHELGVHPKTGEGPVPSRVTRAVIARANTRDVDVDDSDGDGDDVGFSSLVHELDEWLSATAEHDATEQTRIDRDRRDRAARVAALYRGCVEEYDTLHITQDALDREVRAALAATAEQFEQLNQHSHLAGGALKIDGDYRPTVPHPDDDEGSVNLHAWEWHVEPAWPLKQNGKPVSYRNSSVNKGQEKIVSTNLLLAAFLAGSDTPGRLLIIDELADSLGDANRSWILQALANAADRAGFTVLATCQDDLLAKSTAYSQQTLLFHYASKEHTLNQPTRVYGYDADDARVRLIRDLVVDGRPFT